MQDEKVTLQELKNRVAGFVHERDWEQYHSPKNMSMAIAIEAAELMEIFLWVSNERSSEVLNEKREAIEDEIADIFADILDFCSICNINLAKAFESKMQKNEKKYPVDKVRGRAVKYTEIK